MNVTKDGIKDRQLHIEDYLQMVSAEQKEYAEVSAHQRIAENNDIITDFQTDRLMEKILSNDNLNQAYKKVKSNKGAGGVDRMSVDELLSFLRNNGVQLKQQLMDGKYKPNPVRRVEIPKETKGEFRKLGVPTVVDRVFQQAITQVLSPIYEEQFSENSYGFRPGRGAHDALKQCQTNVNDGYGYVVDMDLEKFFDTVCQSKLIEVLSRTIKDGRVISLIHKYLNAGVISRGVFERTEVGMPQGGPLSPLLSNIMLNELDKELTRRGHTLEDKPGQLKKVAEIVSRCGSNVVSVQHDGSDPNMPISSCFLKLTLETRDAAQIEQIRAELAKEGFQLVSERV